MALAGLLLGAGPREEDPEGDRCKGDPGRRRDALARDHRDHRGDRPLSRDEGGDDADLARSKGGVREQEPDHVADPGHGEPRPRLGVEVLWHALQDHAGTGDRQADQHHPREQRPRADHAARARVAQRDGREHERGAEAAGDRLHDATVRSAARGHKDFTRVRSARG
jgi:hypothetical protein